MKTISVVLYTPQVHGHLTCELHLGGVCAGSASGKDYRLYEMAELDVIIDLEI